MDAHIKTLHLCVSPLKGDTENWISHCREMDLIGLGGSEEEAFLQLLRAIKVQWNLCHCSIPGRETLPFWQYPPDDSWLIWHQTASPMSFGSLHQILDQWQNEDFPPDMEIQLTLNPRPFVKDKRFRLIYDLVEVLYGINHRLQPQQKLKLDNGLAEDHKIIMGEGLTGHLQAYPIAHAKIRRLSGHYVKQLINRFGLNLNLIPELIAPRVVHVKNR